MNVTHVIFLNAGFIYVAEEQGDVYSPAIYHLTRDEYDRLHEWVTSGGFGTYTLTVNDAVLTFEHSKGHRLRYTETEFRSMKDTKELPVSRVVPAIPPPEAMKLGR